MFSCLPFKKFSLYKTKHNKSKMWQNNSNNNNVSVQQSKYITTAVSILHHNLSSSNHHTCLCLCFFAACNHWRRIIITEKQHLADDPQPASILDSTCSPRKKRALITTEQVYFSEKEAGAMCWLLGNRHVASAPAAIFSTAVTSSQQAHVVFLPRSWCRCSIIIYSKLVVFLG